MGGSPGRALSSIQPVTAVFGLGEAGHEIALDLARAGLEVHAFDPADVTTPPGVVRHDTPGEAVASAGLVLAITAARDAQAAVAQALDRIRRGSVYADLSTAPPGFKEDLADTAALRGLRFADVALMATVPGRGLATPSLVSGPGAVEYARVINELGGAVDVVGDEPGEAAARKLLRSVVMKSLASSVIEGLHAAESLDLADWYWDHVGEIIESADRDLLMRLVAGTHRHADRREIEMGSAAALLRSLGVEPTMSEAAAVVIRRVGDDGPVEVPHRS